MAIEELEPITITNLFKNPEFENIRSEPTLTYENLAKVPMPNSSLAPSAGGWSYQSSNANSTLEYEDGPGLYSDEVWLKRTYTGPQKQAGSIYAGLSSTDRLTEVEEGLEYYVSMWFISSLSHESVRVVCRFYDSEGEGLGANKFLGHSESFAGEWIEIGGLVTAPEGAVYMRNWVGPQFAADYDSGDYCGGTGLMVLLDSRTPREYFDHFYSPYQDQKPTGELGTTSAQLIGDLPIGIRAESMRGPIRTPNSIGGMGIKTLQTNPRSNTGNDANYGFYITSVGNPPLNLSISAHLEIPEGFDSSDDTPRARRLASGTSGDEGPQYGPDPGLYDISYNLTRNNDTTTNLRFGGSGSWQTETPIWSLPTVVEGKYSGPPFSGDSDPFLYEGQLVFPKWDGEPHNSTSSFNYFPDLPLWERVVDWDSPGQRRFEAGVDRGMFYPPEGDGVPWNGLISVNLNPGEGQMESHYVDGIKFDLDVPPTDYSATVEAFTYPEQLDECMGSPTHDDLLSLNVHGQMSKPFSFAYRTLIGDGEGGVEKGYKLHLVYNAYATPTATPHGTLEQMSMASNFTWNVQTIPQKLPGYRSTSYLTIDSTKTNPIVMEALEQVLYGADGVPPELPPMAEIISYLETYR